MSGTVAPSNLAQTFIVIDTVAIGGLEVFDTSLERCLERPTAAPVDEHGVVPE